VSCTKPNLIEYQDDYHKPLQYGDDQRALDKAKNALTVFENAYGSAHHSVALILIDLGHMYLAAENVRDAQSSYLQAVDILDSSSGDVAIDLIDPLSTLATMYIEQGKSQKALKVGERAFSIAKMSFDKMHPKYVLALVPYAAALMNVEEFAQAKDLYVDLSAIAEEMHGLESLEYAYSLTCQGNVYRRLEQYETAIDFYRSALSINEALNDTVLVDMTVNDLNGLAYSYLSAEKYVEAFDAFERLKETVLRLYGPEKPEIVWAYDGLAQLLFIQGKYDESYDLYMEALRVIRKGLGVRHPNAPTVLNGLARIMMRRGDKAKANEYANNAYDVMVIQKGIDHPSLQRQQQIIDSII